MAEDVVLSEGRLLDQDGTPLTESSVASGFAPFTPSIDTIAEDATYTLATTAGGYGAASYGLVKDDGVEVKAWFRAVLLPTSPATEIDLGTTYLMFNLPVVGLDIAADFGAGTIISGESAYRTWPVKFVMDPVYSGGGLKVNLERSDLESNIATDDQTDDPPPAFMGGEGPGAWSQAGSLTSASSLVILRGRLSYPKG